MADIRFTTTILDDFNRADETPLYGGGNWGYADTGIWGETRLHNNHMTTYNNGFQVDISMWLPQSFHEDMEVWGQATAGAAGAGGTGWRLGFLRDRGHNSVDGYQAFFYNGIPNQWVLRRYSNGGYTVIASAGASGLGHGLWTLMQWVGNTITVYRGDSLTSWVPVITKVDATYSNNDGSDWYLNMGVDDVTNVGTVWDNFGGGIQQLENRTQYYRWLRGRPRVTP